MVRKQYPEFHKTMMEAETYPSASRRIKHQETHRSHLYRTGDHLYKIRKGDSVYSSLAIKERFARDALTLGRHWAGEVAVEVVPLLRQGDTYALGEEKLPGGEVVAYALQYVQLSDHYWLNRLLAAGKVTPTAMGRIARFLAEAHAGATLEDKGAEAGRPEYFGSLMEEMLYQCKKYVPVTVSQPMLEIIARPIIHFTEDARKLFARRQKRGRIVNGHGAFVPNHIFMKGREVHALSPLDGQPKYRILDAAGDVASLVNTLELAGAHDLIEIFIKRYMTAAKDRDLPRMLPAYRVMQAVRQGLMRSEWLTERPEDDPERKARIEEAGGYFNLAVMAARDIPKDF